MGGPPPPAEQIESDRREGDVAILPALALTNGDEHAGRVDVGNAQTTDLAEAEAGGVEKGEQDLVAEGGDVGEKRDQLVDRENDREMTLPAPVRNAHHKVRAIDDVEIEEAERADTLVEPGPGGALDVAQEEQILLDLAEAEPIG
jgi:hypothetical protein